MSIITFRSASAILSNFSPLFDLFKFVFKAIIPVVIICNIRFTNKNFSLSPHSAFMYLNNSHNIQLKKIKELLFLMDKLYVFLVRRDQIFLHVMYE